MMLCASMLKRDRLHRGRTGFTSAARAFAIATNRARNLIDISACKRWLQIFKRISNGRQWFIVFLSLSANSNGTNYVHRVITGVALQKRNRVIQFVILERTLQPNFEVEPMRYGPGQWRASTFNFLNSTESKDGIDYHTLTWQQRSLNLDTIILPPHQVLTGVRFILLDGNLALQIRGTDIDFSIGKLTNLENSEWVNGAATEERTRIEVKDGDVPSRSKDVHTPVDSRNKYIDFRSTSIQKDLAQVTVPYIESVMLEASDPQPLAGLGLYYKSDVEYSGFIAVKLIAYELQSSIEPPATHAVYHSKENTTTINALPTNLNLNSGDLKAKSSQE